MSFQQALRRGRINDGTYRTMEGFFKRAFTPELAMDLLTTGQIFAPFIQRVKTDGIHEGVAKGEAKKQRQIAMNLLADGMSPEYVAKVAGMEVDDVKKLTGGA
jgi:hypothetical protein